MRAGATQTGVGSPPRNGSYHIPWGGRSPETSGYAPARSSGSRGRESDMDAEQRGRLAGALGVALRAHGDQTRKGKQVPYVSHLLQVAGLVLEHGGDFDQAIAGLLHDTLEDCEDVDAETLRREFGPEVTRIVEHCSDLLEGDTPAEKSPWLARKRRYLGELRRADERTRLVAACDKLHNLRTLVADLHAEGAETLSRFSASPEQTRWYYEQVREALGGDLDGRLLGEFDALLRDLGEWVPRADAGS